MGRQWNTIIESLGPLSGGTMSINANLTEIEALLTTLQADVADGITVSSGTVNAFGWDNPNGVYAPIPLSDGGGHVVVAVDQVGSSFGSVPISGTVTANVGIASETDVTQFGEWIANGFNAAQPTISVIGNSSGQPFPISGTVTANLSTSTSGGTGATTATSTTFATALASNTSRKGATIFNEGTGIMYLTLGTATTSTSQYTTRLSGGDYYELPYNYTGQVGYIFVSAGTARVTEIV
jgi:hypothetical protein